MTRKLGTHIVTDAEGPAVFAPKHPTKQEFGKRVLSLMHAKGWSQSELARQAGLPRDSISGYVNGKSLPTPRNLKALADTFGIKEAELTPKHIQSAINEDNPSFEMKSSTSAPGMAWLRVNRLVTMAAAIKIADILEHDRAVDESRSSALSSM